MRLALRDLEERARHTERREEARLEKALERHAGGKLDYPPQQVWAHRIDPARPRIRQQRKRREPVGELPQIRCVGERRHVRKRSSARPHRKKAEPYVLVAQRAIDPAEVAEAAGVREQMADRDGRSGRATAQALSAALAETQISAHSFVFNPIDTDLDPMLLGEAEGVAQDTIELTAYHALSGSHVGLLPDHYADQWVHSGDLVSLEDLHPPIVSEFHAVRVQPKGANAALDALWQSLQSTATAG